MEAVIQQNTILLLTENWPMFEEARSMLILFHMEKFSWWRDEIRCKWKSSTSTCTHMKLT